MILLRISRSSVERCDAGKARGERRIARLASDGRTGNDSSKIIAMQSAWFASRLFWCQVYFTYKQNNWLRRIALQIIPSKTIKALRSISDRIRWSASALSTGILSGSMHSNALQCALQCTLQTTQITILTSENIYGSGETLYRTFVSCVRF